MAKITWTDKVTIDPRPDISAANKLTADDINEVKTSVNAAYDEISALETDHAALEADFTNHKINVSNPHEVTAAQLPDLQSKIDETTNPIKQDVADLEANKVDKAIGESLITDAERTKLQGIEAGAEVNTVSQMDLTDIRSDYNGKLDLKVDKVSGQRLMSDAEGTKLAGIEEGAQVNTVSPSDLTALETSLNDTIDADVSAEASLRSAADTNLQNNINAEESAREAADVTLQENIDAEATARDAADVALQADIDTRLPIDGIESVNLPTAPSPDGWYTIATMNNNTKSIGLFEIWSSTNTPPNVEHQVIKLVAGVAYNSNPTLKIESKTQWSSNIDIKAFRILVGDASNVGAKLQVQLDDISITSGRTSLKGFVGEESNRWNVIEPVLENTVDGYNVGCQIDLIFNATSQQTGDNYVQNNKRVLNTDDLSDINTDISGKEDAFSKNTAFNKNFGTTAGTVREGNNPFDYSEITGKPSTFTPNLNSTFSDIQENVVSIESELDLSSGNVFIGGKPTISVTNIPEKGKRASLVISSNGSFAQVTFNGSNVFSDSPINDGGLNFPPGVFLIFNIVSDGTNAYITKLGTYAQ